MGVGPSTQRDLVVSSGTGNVEAMRGLLQQDHIDANACLEDGDFPLLLAATHGQVAACALLIGAKADVNNQVVIGKYGALHMAAMEGRKEVIDLLLAAKATVDLPNSKGQSPLMMASMFSQLEASKVLIAAGADLTLLDDNMNEALSHAADNDHPEMIRYLVGKGCDPTLRNKLGNTPITLVLGSSEGINALSAGLRDRLRARRREISLVLDHFDDHDENIVDLILDFDPDYPVPLRGLHSKETENQMLRLMWGDDEDKSEQDDDRATNQTNNAASGTAVNELQEATFHAALLRKVPATSPDTVQQKIRTQAIQLEVLKRSVPKSIMSE